MPVVLQNTGWNRVADFVLKQVRNKMGQPTRRKDALGGFKRNSYMLNDTDSLSNSLAMEVLQMDENTVQLALTYPNTNPNNNKAKIFFETGRKPGKGVNIKDLEPWAMRKLPGFAALDADTKRFRLIRISMAIKQKGIGTYPIFDPSFTNELGQEYERWWNTLSDEEIEQLPVLDDVFNVLNNIRPFDVETIDIFR